MCNGAQMKVFWYGLFLTVILVLGIVGWRGQVFLHEPVQIFSDMVKQDRLNPQSPDDFFLNGSGARSLLPGTAPLGLREELPASSAMGNALTYTTPDAGYYETGVWDGYYGQDLPSEVRPATEVEAMGFLTRGRTVYENNCAVCHGSSGNGKGVVASYPGFPVLVDWMDSMYERVKFPDGRLFFVITHGQGNMSGYGAWIPVRDRWAVVSYIRALQTARAKAETSSGKKGKDEK